MILIFEQRQEAEHKQDNWQNLWDNKALSLWMNIHTLALHKALIFAVLVSASLFLMS